MDVDQTCEGPFDDEGLMLDLGDLLSEDRQNVSWLEQQMFDYGHELSDIEEDVLEELKSWKPLVNTTAAVSGSGVTKKTRVSGGNGKTRLRAVPRKRKKPSEIEDTRKRIEARLAKLYKNFSHANKKMWKVASQNRSVAPIMIRDFFTADGKRNHNKRFPPVPSPTVWDDSKPRSMVSEDNVLLVAAFPAFLKQKGHDILYEALLSFGELVDVGIKSAADRKGRDAFESYLRTTFDGELSGVFQLVTLWKPIIAAKDTQAGPARDVIKNVINLNLAFDLLRKLRIVSHRIQDMYQVVDPEQHRFLTTACKAFREKYAWYDCLAAIDPSFFHGRSLIFNRATPLHADRRDPKQNLTPIITLGTYTSGTLYVPELGLEIAYGPGTLVLLRGGILKHRVEFEGGQRISIAHFLHQYMLDELVESIPPLSNVAPAATPAEEQSVNT